MAVGTTEKPQPIYVELTAPDGISTWRFGNDSAPSQVTGSAGDFCHVGAQRLNPENSTLQTDGPYVAAALTVLRNYAG